jgi:hypothetical protein
VLSGVALRMVSSANDAVSSMLTLKATS